VSTYDRDRQLYINDAGYGPFPVLLHEHTDQLQHLAVPQLFMAGARVAVCDQNISLDWCEAIRIGEPTPICSNCTEMVNRG